MRPLTVMTAFTAYSSGSVELLQTLAANRFTRDPSNRVHRGARGLRSMGTIVGDEPTWIVPNVSNPCRW
jgi:hypothetical protein